MIEFGSKKCCRGQSLKTNSDNKVGSMKLIIVYPMGFGRVSSQ